MKEDARAKLARYIAADPRISVPDLAKKARVTRQRVYQLLEAMGYEQDCVWRRAARAPQGDTAP